MIKFYEDKMLRPAKETYLKLEKRLAGAILSFAIKKRPEYFNARVTETASIAARKIIREEMVKQRLAKCEIEGCLIRSPLRRFNESLVCQRHFNILSKAKTHEGVRP